MVIELLGMNRAFGLRALVSSGILIRLLLGFCTGFILKVLGG